MLNHECNQCARYADRNQFPSARKVDDRPIPAPLTASSRATPDATTQDELTSIGRNSNSRASFRYSGFASSVATASCEWLRCAGMSFREMHI